MAKASAFLLRRSAGLGLAALALALVIVPAAARAHQRVERRDATRLSVRHNWIGIAPPTKAVVAPQQVVVIPALTAELEPRLMSQRAIVAPPPSPNPVFDFSPDPLRGPPPARFA